MDREELEQAIEGMLYGSPETIGIEDIQSTLREVCEIESEVPSLEEVRAACDALAARGVLQKAGRTGYELTSDRMAAHIKPG